LGGSDFAYGIRIDFAEGLQYPLDKLWIAGYAHKAAIQSFGAEMLMGAISLGGGSFFLGNSLLPEGPCRAEPKKFRLHSFRAASNGAHIAFAAPSSIVCLQLEAHMGKTQFLAGSLREQESFACERRGAKKIQCMPFERSQACCDEGIAFGPSVKAAFVRMIGEMRCKAPGFGRGDAKRGYGLSEPVGAVCFCLSGHGASEKIGWRNSRTLKGGRGCKGAAKRQGLAKGARNASLPLSALCAFGMQALFRHSLRFACAAAVSGRNLKRCCLSGNLTSLKTIYAARRNDENCCYQWH
jgi:hypothetical protein